MSLGKEVSILYAVTSGFIDDVPVEKVITWEENFHRFMESTHSEIIDRINKDLEIKADTEEQIKAAITEFKQGNTN